MGAALVGAAAGFGNHVDTVNVVVMVRPGPQPLWRKLLNLVLKWVLLLHVLLVTHLAFRIGQPVETLALCTDMAWHGGAALPWSRAQMPYRLHAGVSQWLEEEGEPPRACAPGR